MTQLKAGIKVHVRWMIRRDLEEALAIETASFIEAWNEADFLRCLRKRDCIRMVAEHKEKVVGFVVYQMHQKRIEILNFAVHPDYRRQGVGWQLFEFLYSKLSGQRRAKLSYWISERNLHSHLFLKAMGFRAVAVERNAGEDGADAYRFVFTYREDRT